jgi:hypothetical protein
MPLVVPGINSTGSGDNLQNEWMSKLMGKKLTDSASDHSVSTTYFMLSARFLAQMGRSNSRGEQSFSKKELPSNHRVVEGESMMSMDHKPDR